VDMIEIAASSRAESRDEVFAKCFTKRLLKIVFVVSAVFCPANRVRMHRENGYAGERFFCLRVTSHEDADIGIGWAGGTDDVGIHLAGVEGHVTILHPIAAIESKAFGFGDAGFELGGLFQSLSLLENLHQSISEEFGVIDSLLRVAAIFIHGGFVE